MIQLTHQQWNTILSKLEQEHPRSVMLIRGKMREVLGFTVREHHQWVDTRREAEDFDMLHHKGHYKNYICLDFYDDRMETWFRLKYAELL